MQNNALRIAISGPNASGKTTLAKAISEKYAIPIIEENLSVLFGAQKKLDQLHSQSAPQEEVKSALGRWQESFFDWAKSREAEYSKNDSFVADRWEADLLDIWLVLMRRQENIDPQTVRLVRHVKAAAARLSFAILMPLAKPLSDVPNDAGLVRVSSFSNRLLNSMTTTGIIYSLPNLNVLRMPVGLSSTDDQMKIVESAWSKERTVNGTSAHV